MGDFGQNTTTNREALLNYIDTSAGGGGGSQTLEQVLGQGNSTGGNYIISPDGNSELLVTDGTAYMGVTDNISLESYITLGVSSNTLTQTDNATNDNNSIVQNYNGVDIRTSLNGNSTQNSLVVNQTTVVMETFTSPSQVQQIYVDQDTCNMSYNDGINLIDVELGLSNGFLAQFVGGSDFEHKIQILYSAITLLYNNQVGGKVTELVLDDLGYKLTNLPSYDDNAAALTGGLTAGYLFKTTGSGAITTSGVVCVVE